MKIVIKRANSYFLQDTKMKEEVQITEKEFVSEYSHRTKFPYVNEKCELVYVIKESE